MTAHSRCGTTGSPPRDLAGPQVWAGALPFLPGLYRNLTPVTQVRWPEGEVEARISKARGLCTIVQPGRAPVFKRGVGGFRTPTGWGAVTQDNVVAPDLPMHPPRCPHPTSA